MMLGSLKNNEKKNPVDALSFELRTLSIGGMIATTTPQGLLAKVMKFCSSYHDSVRSIQDYRFSLNCPLITSQNCLSQN